MYFNRKNAEQKNWRMIKKGKHFLFGCSLVFAVGASLATQVVHANTAETTVANNSTTGDVNPTPNGDGKTYEAPAAVAEIKPEVATTPAVAEKLDGETAKEVKTLDKTKLENYIAEIEAKLANGTYENKTEESVAVLKADLEAAKATLANATTQAEIKKAYSKLVTTANTKLKNKPVEKKETPAVDTTNGQPTVGKKAENTEKKSESNSIENTGSNDSRNGKALDKNNAFRAEVAYSEGTNAAANGHSDTYILNDVNKATSTDDAVNAVSRVTNYKVKYNKDASGKITSLDWLVFYNDHAENLSNTYNTDGGDVYRNFIQIPAEVNMPTSITRAKYNSPIQGKLNPKTKKLERTKPDGSALSNSVTFENPAPATAAGLPLDKKDTFSLASGWESDIYGRSIEKLAGQEDRYFKSAASNSSPRTKELLDNVALNDKRLIVDRSTTGGSGYDGYAWSFRTEVPATTSNEQLKDMKVVFGMMRSATAGANAGFANIATNPIKMWQSDVSTPTAKDQTVKVGQKPDATKSIGNLDTLPKGTTVKYKDAVDTQTPGEKQATAVVTYPDTSTKEVPVKVIVEKEAVAPAKPVITTSLTGKANTKTPVEVKAEAGSSVSLFAKDGTKLGTAVASAQGVASITPTVNIPAGTVAATATKNGKTSEVSDPVEATPAAVTPQPETPKPSTPAPGVATNKPEADAATSAPEIVNNLEGKASTPADVTVKAPAGSTVKLYNTDGVVIGEAVANAQGVATIHPTNSLPEGNITATSTPAGGKESAKSAPITVTKTPLTIKDGGVTGNNDTRLLVSKDIITVYPGDKIDVDVIAQATALEKFSVEKNPTAISGVLPTGGFLDKSRGATIRQRDAKYSGTVAMNQPAGTTEVVFHARNRDKPTTLYRSLIVNVLETAKKYEPVAGKKLDVANSNNLSEDDKNKVIASVKAANPSLPADSQYSVDEKGNLTITYPDGSKDKIAAAYLVNPAPTDADKNTPTAKPQTVDKGTTPKAEDSIGNVKDLPKGTKVAFKDPVDTATPGEKDATVVVTYPDGSTEEVPVKVTVKAPSSAPTTPTAPATPVVAPTVEIPYSNKDTKEVYVYAGEENSFDIKFKDDSGKIASATVKQGGNRAFDDVAGEANTINTQYGFKANVINAETPATEKAPAVITYSGTPAATDGLAKDKLEAATKGENPEGMALGWRYATATDKDGAFIENKAVGSSTATDPGAFRVMLKGQTQKYDIATPTEKVTVADPANVTDADLAKIKEKLQLEYSQNNDDANLADKKGKAVSDKDAKIQSVTKDDKGNLVVTYKDGSQDKKPLSEFVNVAPTVELPYSNQDKKQIYVYTGENTDLTFTGKDETTVKDLYLRGPGGVTGVNAADYGFTVGKIDNGAVTNGEGTVSKDKRTATIKMTGTTNLKAGQQWTSFIEAKDSDDAKSMTGANYNAETDDAARQQKPGYVNFIVKSQTDKYDIKAPTEKVSVVDPANVTEADLAKIKEKLQLEYNKKNDDANIAKDTPVDKDGKIKSVTKDADGNLVVTYPDGSTDKKPLSEFVTKKPTDADKNTPTAKPQTVDKGTTPKAEDSIGNVKDLPKGTKVAFKDPVDTATPGEKDATVVVTYPDGSTEEVPVKVTVKDPSSAPTDADKNTPTAKPQTVDKGTTPKAEDSIGNVKDLPKGTKVAFKDPVDTATPGEKDATVVVTYPDGSTEEVPVKVTVKDPSSAPTDADKNTPTAKPQTVDKGTTPKAEDSIGNVKDLPKGTKVAFKDPVDTATPGEKDATVVVTYPDGSTEEVPVKVTVKEPSSKPTDADKNEPTPKAQTVDKGTTPKAEDSIGNVKDLPKGTKVAFKDPVDTATPGEKDATVVVTYPDGSTEEVPVKVTVKDPSSAPTDADKNTPTAKPQTVDKGTTPKAEDSIGNVKDLPKGTKVAFKDPVDTATPGEKDATVVVTYPDGSTEEVPVKVTVKDPSSAPTDADKNTPTAKPQTVDKGTTPKAEDSIGNVKDLPKGTKVAFKDPVDTATPGEKDATVVVTYPDGSTEEVPVKVTVKEPSSKPTDADKNEPTPKAQTVDKGTTPKAEDSIGNVKDLPKGTKVAFKDPVDTATPGEKDATVVVTYPDGSTEEVPVKVTVKDPSSAPTDADKNTPTAKPQTVDKGTTPKAEDSIGNVKDLPKGTKVAFKDPVDTATPGEKDATVVVTYPDGSKEEVPVKVTVEEPSSPENPSTKDTDGDGLTDKEEAEKGTDPTKADTDGDGVTDKEEVEKGTDPKDPNSKPEDPTTKDADGVKDPAKTPVKDPANLTDAEKAKVADEVKKANPTAKDVEVGKDGTTTVTFPDGSKAEIPAAKAAEKAKDATPAKDADGVKDPAKTPVKDPANLTDAEKAKVADEVKKANPTAKDVEVGKDGTTTVTFPDGSKAEIPAAKAAEKAKDATPAKDADGVKDPAKTPVKDPANLTDAEKAKVADEVKKANPTAKDVEVGKDGTTTVTFPDGSTAEIPAAKAAEKAKDATPAKDADGVKDPAKTPVKDPANLTDAEKAKVADEVKKANPTAKDVEVGKDGTTTVTFPDGSKAEIPAAKAAEKAKDATPAKDADGVKDPAKTPVKDPANLTDAEKAKVADEVKKANPTAKDVEVGKDGTTTVTFPDGSKAEIPAAKAAEKAKDATPAKDADGVKDPAKTPVKDPANLTDAEKAKVADEVKKANPTAKDVEVGKDGTTTVTFPDGSTAEIPAAKAAEKAKDATPAKDADGVKDPAKTPVKDPANLTDAEKAKVADEVKKANPTAKDVEVGKDGTTTVTFPDGSTAEIPAAKAAEKAKDATPAKDADGVKDPAKTPVKDPANLTDAEKAKVADEVKKANPTAKDVEVGKDGTTTVTFPDGSKAEIPAAKAAEKAKDATPAKDADGVKDPAKTPVKDPANLTDAEKAKVADEVKKANPTAKDVEVGKDGTTTVTFPDGSKAEIPAAKAAEKAKDATPAKDADGVKDPAKTPVKDPANLTDAEKAKVADEVKKANPTAKDVEVGKDGTTTVTFPDGSKAEIPAAKAAEKAKDATPAKDADGVKDPAKTPVKDPANLTDAEKAKVADEVKKANPTAKDVEVGKDGTTTVTFPDGSKAEIPAAKAAEKAKDATPAKDADGVKDPAKTPVKDPANLTDAEKAKVADEVKKANPTAKDVEVGKDGTTTVTFPDGSTAEIPAAKAAEKAKDATPAKDADGVKDPAKTPVKDPANLTDAEKAKVADEVKKANPTAKDVEVGKDGTTTVTFPDGSKAEIPAAKAAEKAKDATPAKDADGVKDPAKTPVKDPANLTDAEKAKVADEVKKANPTAKDVEVGKDGTTTVTFPDGSKAEIPAAKAAEKAKDATPAKDADGVKDPAKTPVKDPANLTDAEKAKVADEVKKANPTAKDVEVGKDGTTTVTFPDGSKAEIPAAKAAEKAKDATPAKDADGVKDPAKTPVKDPANLTDAEKAKVADEVKKANPTAKDVEVGKDGTTTVTFPDGSKAEIPAAKAAEKAKDATPAKDADGVKDPAKTPVKDPANLTDAEKAKVADEVKKANPTAKDVEVGKDGTTTVTFPDGSKAEIPAAKAAEKAKDATPAKDADGVKDPAKTPVKDPANLTDAEKAKVADEVKKANPTAKDVEVGKDGTTTVTFPDGSTAVIPSGDTVKKSSDNAVKDPAVTPVVDPSNLTEAEKAKVADEVKKSNPTVTDVKVGKDGTTTVTFPDGSTAVIPSGDAVKKSSDNAVKDPAVTPVVDPSNLTEAEKAKVADEVKKSNPTVTDVKVGKDGTATVTYPDGSTAVIPSGDTVKKSSDNAVKDPAVTPVVDPSNLTEAEKAKVADEVKKSNPTVTDVKVGKDGTTTVTFPDGSTAVIPSGDTVKKSSDNAVKDPAVTPVVDPSNLTEAEKAKVADEVKKSNPTVTDVKVGKDGTATVTYPDGSTAVIPSGDTVKKSSDNAVKDPAVTPVVDPSNLTEAEKAKVADEVKKSNPTVTDVKVGRDGTTTVTFPDGSTVVIPSGDTVKKSSDNAVKDPAVTPVVDPSNLTEAEKAKVADEVKKSNPTVTDVKVGKDGTTTVTFPDGSTAVIPSGDTVKKSSDNAVKDPAVTPVVDPSNLTEAEKAKVADEVKKSNPTATDVKVGKDGTTTVTFPDGSTAVIPADKAVTSAEQGSHGVAPAGKAVTSAEQGSNAATPAKKAGAKELPNTGTADSTVAMVAAAASALLGLGLAGRRRKEDEEA